MRKVSRRLALAWLLLSWAPIAAAQTADEVIEKCLTALGGRANLAKLKSRSSTGTITLETPGGPVTGSIELLNAAPNKSRTLIKVDLSSLGGGPATMDQRFNGQVGYVIDTLQGNRDITGGQLELMRNSSFPHPLLDYKQMGSTARLGGREKIGEREAYLLILEFATGQIVRQYIDAESYLPTRLIVSIDVPQLGGEIEQTTEFLDYRAVDGIKMPFAFRSTSSVQNFTVNLTKVEHNVKVDEALFSKPASP